MEAVEPLMKGIKFIISLMAGDMLISMHYGGGRVMHCVTGQVDVFAHNFKMICQRDQTYVKHPV